jgi:hypothetical protein
LRQASPIGTYAAGLEPEAFGGEQDFIGAEGPAGLGEIVGQLVGVGGNVVKAGEHDEAQQAGVRVLRPRIRWRRRTGAGFREIKDLLAHDTA